MPSLIDLRRRIRSVKNTQQITKAMKMMSAARLRRAQERVVASRPYALLMRQFLGRLVASLEANAADKDQASDAPLHPLLARRPVKRILLLVMGGDKGLAGAFNANVHKAAANFLQEHHDKQVDMIAIGRKPRDFFRRRRALTAEFADLFAKVKYEDARDIAGRVTRAFAAGEIDEVYIIFNEFRSVLIQRLCAERLLPLEKPKDEGGAPVDYIFEQPPAELLASLLPRYVEVQVFRALLESSASEHAARMTAMDAASKNASEMIDRLTLNMNRIRQASITREIIEIVSGAAALE
jgi:F-type H+-transporting ATPase subunit gamma